MATLQNKTRVAQLRQQAAIASPSSPKSDRSRRSQGYRKTSGSAGDGSSVALGYLCIWSSHSRRRRRVVADVGALRGELLAPRVAGLQRLLVIYEADQAVIEILSGIAGVETRFLKAHEADKRYRPGDAESKDGVRGWCWEYPQDNPTQDQRATSRLDIPFDKGRLTQLGTARRFSNPSIDRASLWRAADDTYILLLRRSTALQGVDAASGSTSTTSKATAPPSLLHQDAASNLLQRQSFGGGYGALDPYPVEHPATSGLEQALYESLGGDISLQESICNLVHGNWLDFFDHSLWPGPGFRRGTFQGRSQAIRALERNVDTARDLELRSHALDFGSSSDYRELLSRAYQRLQLISLSSSSSRSSLDPLPAPSTDRQDANARSLDRIAYLGGALLPVTVVSGVLSIEGDYGPGGNNFWVFWISSLIFSILALIIIYIDQVRRLDVWMEVSADAVLESACVVDPRAGTIAGVQRDDELEGVSDEALKGNVYRIQRSLDGARSKVWKRGQLGWGGAVKRVSGYYRWTGSSPLPRLQVSGDI